MRIGNRYFGTSGMARPGGGAGWFDTNKLPAGYLAQFREVHVPKLGPNSFAPARPGSTSLLIRPRPGAEWAGGDQPSKGRGGRTGSTALLTRVDDAGAVAGLPSETRDGARAQALELFEACGCSPESMPSIALGYAGELLGAGAVDLAANRLETGRLIAQLEELGRAPTRGARARGAARREAARAAGRRRDRGPARSSDDVLAGHLGVAVEAGGRRDRRGLPRGRA